MLISIRSQYRERFTSPSEDTLVLYSSRGWARAQRGTRPVFETRATMLRRVDGIGAKCGSGMPTPARVVEKPARQRNEIRLAAVNDCFRLVRADDHADRLHRDAAGLFDGGGERHLVARAKAGRACALMPPEETQT
jgi:hypothetical protein